MSKNCCEAEGFLLVFKIVIWLEKSKACLLVRHILKGYQACHIHNYRVLTLRPCYYQKN